MFTWALFISLQTKLQKATLAAPRRNIEHFSRSSVQAACNVTLSHHLDPHFKTHLITSVVEGYWTRKTNQAVLGAFLITGRECIWNNCFCTWTFFWAPIRKWAVSLWLLLRKDYWQSRICYHLSFLAWTNTKPFLKYQLFRPKSLETDIASSKQTQQIWPRGVYSLPIIFQLRLLPVAGSQGRMEEASQPCLKCSHSEQ